MELGSFQPNSDLSEYTLVKEFYKSFSNRNYMKLLLSDKYAKNYYNISLSYTFTWISLAPDLLIVDDPSYLKPVLYGLILMSIMIGSIVWLVFISTESDDILKEPCFPGIIPGIILTLNFCYHVANFYFTHEGLFEKGFTALYVFIIIISFIFFSMIIALFIVGTYNVIKETDYVPFFLIIDIIGAIYIVIVVCIFKTSHRTIDCINIIYFLP